jgi:hypothetical protein
VEYELIVETGDSPVQPDLQARRFNKPF